jgi:hypothetical protein
MPPEINELTITDSNDSEVMKFQNKEFKIMIIRMINKINRIQIDT